jgi:hypothetical protein
MHCLKSGGGAAGMGGIYIMVDVLVHIGKTLFPQNVIINNHLKFDRVLWGRLHVVWRSYHYLIPEGRVMERKCCYLIKKHFVMVM